MVNGKIKKMNLFFKDQNIKKVKILLRLCPITSGNPTRMTETAFRSACERLNMTKEKRGGFGPRQHETNLHEEHCKQCGGQYPPELTIITLEDYDMGSVTSYQGTCELCGKHGKTLRKVFDKKVCSVCEHVRRAAHNAPGLLVQSIIDAKGEKWLAGLLKLTDVPMTTESDLDGDIAALKEERDKLKTFAADLAENNINLVKTAKAQIEEIETLTAEVATAKNANGDMLDMLDNYNTLSDEEEDLRECNKNLSQERLDLEYKKNQLEGLLNEKEVEIEEARQILGAYGNTSDAALLEICRRRMDIMRLLDEELQQARTAREDGKVFSIIDDLCEMCESPTQSGIVETGLAIIKMLVEKNQSYGNSALEPLRLFSKASPREQILVRLDDKLSRLARGSEFPGDDTIRDLIGYLILLLVQNDHAATIVDIAPSLQEAAA
jgi:hypothetical protein